MTLIKTQKPDNLLKKIEKFYQNHNKNNWQDKAKAIRICIKKTIIWTFSLSHFTPIWTIVSDYSFFAADSRLDLYLLHRYKFV